MDSVGEGEGGKIWEKKKNKLKPQILKQTRQSIVVFF